MWKRVKSAATGGGRTAGERGASLKPASTLTGNASMKRKLSERSRNNSTLSDVDDDRPLKAQRCDRLGSEPPRAFRQQSRGDVHFVPPIARDADAVRLLRPTIGWKTAGEVAMMREALGYMVYRERQTMLAGRSASAGGIEAEQRRVCIDWLAEVCQAHVLMPETWSRAVQLADAFAHARPVDIKDYQLVGMAAVFVAAKIEERYIPLGNQLTQMSGRKSHTPKRLFEFERAILRALDMDVQRPEPVYFARYLVDWCKRIGGWQLTSTQEERFSNGVLYCCVLAQLSPRMYTEWLPSQVAAAAVSVVTQIGHTNSMPHGVTSIFGPWCAREHLQPIEAFVCQQLRAQTSKCVYAWFARHRFHCIAKLNTWDYAVVCRLAMQPPIDRSTTSLDCDSESDVSTDFIPDNYHGKKAADDTAVADEGGDDGAHVEETLKPARRQADARR